MSKDGIATVQHASMGLLCDPRKQEEILNDLWVEWVKLALELELGNAVRHRFPGHSEGAYGCLARWVDELGFISADVRFLAETLWRAIISWFAAGAFHKLLQPPGSTRAKQHSQSLEPEHKSSGYGDPKSGHCFGTQASAPA